MATEQITINRAPVLTLWAAVVAERLGHDRDAALTLGKAVAGLNAASKARRLGIVEGPTDPREARETRGRTPDEPLPITVLGRPVPAIRTDGRVAECPGRTAMLPGVAAHVVQPLVPR